MRVPSWIVLALDFILQLGAVIAASYCAAGALAPWGQATVFHNIDLHIPGVVYRDGVIVLGACLAAIIFRRIRLVGIAASIVIVLAGQDASIFVPRMIKSHIIGAQMALFPVNYLLDQAHLSDITVGSFGQPPSTYLDYGLSWLPIGAHWLLAASVAGLFFDPVLGWIWRRIGFRSCPSCRLHIPVRRAAEYCPRCGVWQLRGRPAPRRCTACRRIVSSSDNFCSNCGAVTPELATEHAH